MLDGRRNDDPRAPRDVLLGVVVEHVEDVENPESAAPEANHLFDAQIEREMLS